MKVNVVGMGKLGLPLAVLLTQKSAVTGIDLNKDVIDQLNDGVMPFFEPELEERFQPGSIQFTTSFEAAHEADATFIVVPTPSISDNSFSAEFVVDAVRRLGASLKGRSSQHVVVIVSTLMPGDTDKVVRPALEAASGRVVGDSLKLCYSPEFIALGQVFSGMERPDVVLIGESDSNAGRVVKYLLLSFIRNDPAIHRMSILEAEIVKIAINTFVTTKISFANYLGELCQVTGASPDKVTAAVGADPRIGFRYFHAGHPYGGPCVPPESLIVARDGLVRIDGIEVGQEVLGHDGKWHRVTKVMSRPYVGDLCEVRVGGQSMQLTSDHPIYGVRRGSQGDSTYRTWIRGTQKTRLKACKVDETSLSFKPAGEYRRGDFVLWPKPNFETSIDRVVFPSRSAIGRPSITPDSLVFSPELCRLIGYYLSEGSTWTKEFKFSLHKNEQDTLAVDISSLCSDLFGLKGRWKDKSTNGGDLVFAGRRVSEWLRQFGTGAANKSVPFEWSGLPENHLINLLRGIWYGDGSRSTGVFTWASVSRSLFTFMKLALIRLDVGFTTHVVPEHVSGDGVNHREAFFVKVANPRHMKRMSYILPGLTIDRSGNRNTVRVISEGLLNPIRSVNMVPYSGTVWNLEVDNAESYVLESGAVHNCFPRDARAFAAFSEGLGVTAELPLATSAVNERQAERIKKQVLSILPDGGTVAVLGLSYKVGTWVSEESAGMNLVALLKKESVPVVGFDPLAEPDGVVLADSLSAAVKDAAVVVVATAWPEFDELDVDVPVVRWA